MRAVGKVILEAVVGSTAHGIAVNDGLEDKDIIAVMIEDPQDVLGFVQEDTVTWRTKPDGVKSEAGDTDYVAYGLRKYIRLVLKCNPTALIPLFVPWQDGMVMTEEGIELRKLAPKFLSKDLVRDAFSGYMRRNVKFLGHGVGRTELVGKHGYDTKAAAHAIRIGIQAIELLGNRVISLPMLPKYREEVIDVRLGKRSLEYVNARVQELMVQVEDAHALSSLPCRADIEEIEQWMIKAYLKDWS